MQNIKAIVSIVVVLAAVFYTLGCAPRSDKELADAEAALQAARDEGALELAPEEYRAAEDLIRRAKELMAQGKHQEARSLLEEARYKAIEAKGKALIAKAQGRMTEEEIVRKEEELSELKGTERPGADIGLMDIFFDFDKFDIRPDARPVLRQNAEIIKNNSGRFRVVIEGYCDIRGTEEYNLALGQKRADATKAYLVGLGVSPYILEAVSRGETDKWAPGNTEYAYQQNRRAHFIVVPISPQAHR
jgi:peptidoglycan-associated lipoprotein